MTYRRDIVAPHVVSELVFSLLDFAFISQIFLPVRVSKEDEDLGFGFLGATLGMQQGPCVLTVSLLVAS